MESNRMQRERVAEDIYVFTSELYARVTAGAVVTPDGAILNTNTPVLQWNAVENAIRYEVKVDNSRDFSSPEYSSIKIWATECTINFLISDIYYWKVRAVNASSVNGKWSGVWSFTSGLK